jgi:hypothetical protein
VGGARNATDEYVAALPRPPLLHRIDFTGRGGHVHLSGFLSPNYSRDSASARASNRVSPELTVSGET